MIQFVAKIPDIDPDFHKAGIYRKLTKWQVDFCDGDVIEALILSLFVAMYNSQRGRLLESIRRNRINVVNGGKQTENETIDLEYSHREISENIFNITKDKEYLKKKITRLEKRGVITIKKALTIRQKEKLALDVKLSTDRTNTYSFHPEPIIKYLQPYLNFQTTRDEEVNYSLSVLQSHGLLIRDKEGYRVKYNNKSATIHQPERQAVIPSMAKPVLKPSEAWSEFIKYSEKNLSRATNEIFSKIKPEFNGVSITLDSKPFDKFNKQIVISYFKEKIQGVEVKFL